MVTGGKLTGDRRKVGGKLTRISRCQVIPPEDLTLLL